jgi:tetratricopeptide (TPR) repeat protein
MVLAILVPARAFGAHDFSCLMPDAICHPPAEKGWTIKHYPEGDVVIEASKDALAKGEYVKPKIVVRRESLNQAAERNLAKYFGRQLTGKLSGARVLPSANEGQFSAVYLYLEHYLPVEGMVIKRVNGDLAYSIECERQRVDANAEGQLIDWCAGYADTIVWPEQREFKPDEGGEINRWSKLPFDGSGIASEYERIGSKDRKEEISGALFNDFIGLLITESLYARSQRSTAELVGDLDMALRRLNAPGSNRVRELIAIHKEFLGEHDAQMENVVGAYIKTYPEVPYWMMSRWMEAADDAAAKSFAERAVMGYPTPIAAFTEASYLSRHGQYAKSDEILAKEKNKDVNSVVLMAQNAMGEGRMKDAERLMKQASRVAPNDIELLFAKAEYFNRQKAEGSYEQATAIYTRLEGMPNLGTTDRMRLYRDMAEMDFDPDRKIEYYQKMLALKPDAVDIYYDLGKVYLMEKHDVGGALLNFKKYLRSAPKQDPKVAELRTLVWKLETSG